MLYAGMEVDICLFSKSSVSPRVFTILFQGIIITSTYLYIAYSIFTLHILVLICVF